MADTPPDDNISKNRARPVAAAIQNNPKSLELPKIIATGRGKWAEQILELAFANGIKVREDAALAEILASVEQDSPIPTEAIMAVAEILAYVYEAEGQGRPDPSTPFTLPEK
jgi:flagellar biosynthesis protein